MCVIYVKILNQSTDFHETSDRRCTAQNVINSLMLLRNASWSYFPNCTPFANNSLLPAPIESTAAHLNLKLQLTKQTDHPPPPPSLLLPTHHPDQYFRHSAFSITRVNSYTHKNQNRKKAVLYMK